MHSGAPRNLWSPLYPLITVQGLNTIVRYAHNVVRERMVAIVLEIKLEVIQFGCGCGLVAGSNRLYHGLWVRPMMCEEICGSRS